MVRGKSFQAGTFDTETLTITLTLTLSLTITLSVTLTLTILTLNLTLLALHTLKLTHEHMECALFGVCEMHEMYEQ